MMRPLTPRILRVYEAATAAQLDEGLNWYRHAHGFAASLDPKNPARAAAVIAALSPRCPWARNAELAARAYSEGVASGTLGRSCRAANAILHGADPLTQLKGWKVRSFYWLITDPEDRKTVCVDRHAIDIALGVRHSDSTRPALQRRDVYDRFVRCYQRAGRVLGETPARVQAVTWVTWRANLAAA